MGNWTLVLIGMRKRTLAAAAALCIAASIGLLAVPARPGRERSGRPVMRLDGRGHAAHHQGDVDFMENRSYGTAAR